jgi:hypothetical protein
VERVLHGDDFEAAVERAPLAGELEEGFVGFGAGVAEKDLAAEGQAGEAFGEAGLDGIVEEVRAVHQGGGLVLDGGDDGGVAVAGVADGDAGHEVEILLAGVVPDGDAGAAHEGDARRIGGHDELLVEVPGIRGCH